QDSLLAKKAAHWLALEWNRVVIPHVDKYRFTKAYAAATGAGGGGTITYDPAAVLEQIYEMNSNVDEVSCPDDGRALFVAPSVFKDIKKEVVPLLNNPGDQMVRSRGLAGTIDGVAVVKVPSNLLPTGVKALFWHKSALLAAQKLHEAKILEGGHVMSGHIIKGRLRHDAWALKGYDSASGINTKLATFQALVAAPPTP
ncbi:MAG: hypothetical protein LBG81_01010, partial [Coriobacteriaceae bacterium]|nr:hypothetical protein [Coriobacteriaceae bacterium]